MRNAKPRDTIDAADVLAAVDEALHPCAAVPMGWITVDDYYKAKGLPRRQACDRLRRGYKHGMLDRQQFGNIQNGAPNYAYRAKS